MILEVRLLWKTTSQITDGEKFPVLKKLMPAWCRPVFLYKIRQTNLLQKFGCHWLKLRLLNIHHLIFGRNWSTKIINYFGLKVIDHQAHLILHMNVKNMMMSTGCYCCCSSIASLLHFWYDLWVNRCLDDYQNKSVFFNWFFILFTNDSGQWRMRQNVQWGRWWGMGHTWWRWRWRSKW